ncbi:MAG: rubrerythrin [Oscillospiraceae bacterium]|nr:rubrerythrin [Oscillospiraceae bacterium]
MNETPSTFLDPAAFQQVWRRVMPEDREDCPFTVEPITPSAPSQPQPLRRACLPAAAPAGTCLGEASAGQVPILDRLIALTADCQRIYRSLARRSGRRFPLATLADAKARQLRRLAAARFLIAGEAFAPAPTPAPAAKTLALALRERFQAEQQLAAELLSAAQSATDPCLSELYQSLAQENQGFAGQLRSWLEQM